MVHIYFDLDDTLINTNEEFLRILKDEYGVNAPIGEYLNSGNTAGFFDTILADAFFMESARPCEVMVRQLEILRSEVRLEFATFNVCTHRGYHRNAKGFTEAMLRANNLQFDSVVYLDPRLTPDKKEYLDKLHQTEQVLLIDDRPSWHSKVEGLDSGILLMDKPWNSHYKIPDSQRITCKERLSAQVLSYLYGTKGR